MEARFANIFTQVSIAALAKDGAGARVGVFGRRRFARTRRGADSVRAERRRGELQRSQHAREQLVRVFE